TAREGAAGLHLRTPFRFEQFAERDPPDVHRRKPKVNTAPRARQPRPAIALSTGRAGRAIPRLQMRIGSTTREAARRPLQTTDSPWNSTTQSGERVYGSPSRAGDLGFRKPLAVRAAFSSSILPSRVLRVVVKGFEDLSQAPQPHRLPHGREFYSEGRR